MNINKYFTITTPEYTYNARLDYGEINNQLNIIQQNKCPIECIVIDIPTNNRIAVIESVNYYTDTTLDSQRNKDTVHLIKTALKYVFDNYKYIEKITITDTTAINSDIDPSVTKPFFITSRRLLTYEKGWYEEKCGAIPENQTIPILNFLEKEKSIIQKLVPKNRPKNWWTKNNLGQIIHNICNTIPTADINLLKLLIYFTDWSITRNTVENFNISYNVSSGGAKNTDHIIKNMNRYMMPIA
jgi:hypothetical protein